MRCKMRGVIAEVVFVTFVLIMAYLYGSQPARRETLAQFKEKWRILREVAANPFQVLVAPFDWATIDLYGLAQFGDELEFLGCDVAITRDEKGTHVWQITIWRALTDLQQDYTLYMHFTKPGDSRPFFAQADHLLGRQFLGNIKPTSKWKPRDIVLDAVMLPGEVQREPKFDIRIGIWVPETGLRLLPQTDLLQVDEYGRVVICR